MLNLLRKHLLPASNLMVLGLVTTGFALAPSQRHRHRTMTPTHPHSTITGAKRAGEYLRLVENLRAQGITVQTTREKLRQPFFSTQGRIINVNNEGLQIFEYANPSRAHQDAQRISANGMTIGTTKPSWMATPHFFKREKLIVLYLGDNQIILKALKATLGDQVAGG